MYTRALAILGLCITLAPLALANDPPGFDSQKAIADCERKKNDVLIPNGMTATFDCKEAVAALIGCKNFTGMHGVDGGGTEYRYNPECIASARSQYLRDKPAAAAASVALEAAERLMKCDAGQAPAPKSLPCNGDDKKSDRMKIIGESAKSLISQSQWTAPIDTRRPSVVDYQKRRDEAHCPPPCPAGTISLVSRRKVMLESAGCTDAVIDLDHRSDCEKLKKSLDAANCVDTEETKADKEFTEFADKYKGPCDPIPAKFTKPDSPYFAKTMALVAPRIALSPDEASPPENLRDLAAAIRRENKLNNIAPAVSGNTTKLPFSKETDQYMGKARTPDQLGCSSIEGGKCCGTMQNTALSLDVTPYAGNKGNGTAITFATTHRYNTYLGSKDLDPTGHGAGNHLFDSEMMTLDFSHDDSDPPGTVRMAQMNFSRHARSTERFTASQLCDGGKYKFDTAGTNPVVYEARGGHALYLDGSSEGAFRSKEKTDNPAEKALAKPAESVEKSGFRSVADLRNDYKKGNSCVATMPTGNFVGVGTLWNDPTIGVNRDGKFGPKTDDSDLCVVQNDKDPPMQQSMRHLGRWMTYPDGLKKLGCGRTPGNDD